MALVIVTLNGFACFFLSMVSVTFVPGLPLNIFTASCRLIPSVLLPLILIIISLDFNPALYAGVSSMGATTVKTPSFSVISIPNPPNFPVVTTFNSLYSSFVI